MSGPLKPAEPSKEATMGLTPGEKLVEDWRTRATKAWIKDRPLVVPLSGSLCFPETQSLVDAVDAALHAERERTLREVLAKIPKSHSLTTLAIYESVEDMLSEPPPEGGKA